MRSVAIAVVFALAVVSGLTSAQCAAVDSNVFMTGASGCPRVAVCRDARVACTATASCATAGACFAAEQRCLLAITATRSNSSDNCSTLGNNLYISQIAAAAAAQLNTTQLFSSCSAFVCVAVNGTGSLQACSLADLTASVCTAANLLGPVSTTPVTTATSGAVRRVALRGAFRFSGGNWAAILNNPARKSALEVAIRSDVANLTRVSVEFVVIYSLSIGSLVVDYGVLDGSGRSTAELSASVATAQGSASWLSSVSSEYRAAGGNDTITTLSSSVTETAAPVTGGAATTTGAPRTSSAFGVAGMWAVAAAATVAALLA
jgi:hypothetical protein